MATRYAIPLEAPYETHLQDFSMGTASKKSVSTTIATRLGWTGWLLVLVYFGALTAISNYIAEWFLFSEELLFYEVFITVIVSTAVLYALARVYTALRDKNSTSKWWGRGLKVLSLRDVISSMLEDCCCSGSSSGSGDVSSSRHLIMSQKPF